MYITKAGKHMSIHPPFEYEEATIDAVQNGMASGRLSALDLTRHYLERIDALDANGPTLRSIIELNPDAEQIAADLDRERAAGTVRGPLHGIPVVIKDNIDTADRMSTTAGSLALLGSRPTQDATIVTRLRAAGAVILGKTNLSEWSSFRSQHSISGWSGRGGQTKNPYELSANPCGSSSGSAVAISANLAMIAIGTETDGSIVCPAHVNGVVGIKPTVGLTSRAGVVPIAHSQDTVGPLARTVRDAAIALGIIAGNDPRDAATHDNKAIADYTVFLDAGGLRGARIGVPRHRYQGYNDAADALIEQAIRVLETQGATIVDPADVPSIDETLKLAENFLLLQYEFKADLEAYLAERVPDERYPDAPFVRTLQDAIAFNLEHADVELQHFGQEILQMASERGPLTTPEYLEILRTGHRLARDEGLDAVLDRYNLDALIAPTGGPAWKTDYEKGDTYSGGSSSSAAVAGYPLVNVPVGFAGLLPVGMTFMGRRYSEPTLIRLAYAFEQATDHRRPPKL